MRFNSPTTLFNAVVFYAVGNGQTDGMLSARRTVVSASPLPFNQAMQCAMDACSKSYAAVSFCVEACKGANHA